MPQTGFARVSLITKVLGNLSGKLISRDIYNQHAGNTNEKALGMKKLRVDEWCQETYTVFEYDGCYYHGHNCIIKHAERAEKQKQSMHISVTCSV